MCYVSVFVRSFKIIRYCFLYGQGARDRRRNSFSRQRAKLQEQSVGEKDNQDLHLPDTSLHRFILHPYTVSFGLVWFLHALRLFHQPHWKSNCVFHLQCTVQTTGQRDFLSIVTFSCSCPGRSDILVDYMKATTQAMTLKLRIQMINVRTGYMNLIHKEFTVASVTYFLYRTCTCSRG